MSEVSSKTARIMTGVVHAVEALEAIGKVAQGISDQPVPLNAEIMNSVRGIAALVTTVLSGIRGAITPDDVDKALMEFRGLIKDNDAAADSALDQKFSSR